MPFERIEDSNGGERVHPVGRAYRAKEKSKPHEKPLKVLDLK
jgi:hypothetical protein